MHAKEDKEEMDLQALGPASEVHSRSNQLAGGMRGQADLKKCDRRLLARVQKKKQQIEKMELQAKVKEDLKTVALGTSKINYLDPRITVAWCKRLEVPIEKIFNRSLLSKFHWAMDVDPEFSF